MKGKLYCKIICWTLAVVVAIGIIQAVFYPKRTLNAFVSSISGSRESRGIIRITYDYDACMEIFDDPVECQGVPSYAEIIQYELQHRGQKQSGWEKYMRRMMRLREEKHDMMMAPPPERR